MERTMKQALAIAVAVVGIGLFSAGEHAGGDVANAQAVIAWPNSAPDIIRHQVTIDRSGNSMSHKGPTEAKSGNTSIDRGCWFDPDIPRCE